MKKKPTKSIKNILLFILFTSLFACSNTDEPEITETISKTIPIDAQQAYNQDNFIKSFEQLFVSHERWAWSFSHDLENNKLLKTYQKKHVFGDFGEVLTIDHNYNNMGVITHSTCISSTLTQSEMVFEYEYDLEGYIIKITKKINDLIFHIVRLTYNEDGNLLMKKYDIFQDEEISPEKFVYDSEGNIIEFYDVDGRKTQFSYLNGLMFEEKTFYTNYTQKSNYSYDDENKVIQIDIDDQNGPETRKIEYFTDKMIYYFLNSNGNIKYKNEYITGFILIKDSYYSRDFDTQEVNYHTEKEFDSSTGLASKAYYYESNQILGSIIVDKRELTDNILSTTYSIYDSENNLLYYFIVKSIKTPWGNYNDESYEFKDSAGNTIEDPYSDIQENWVYELISII